MNEEENGTTGIMFRLISFALCALIIALFVMIVLIPGFRTVFYNALLVLGFLLNALLAAWYFTHGKKRGWIFMAATVAVGFLIINELLHFL